MPSAALAGTSASIWVGSSVIDEGGQLEMLVGHGLGERFHRAQGTRRRRAWFKGVKSHSGIRCDIAYGRPTGYDMRREQILGPYQQRMGGGAGEAVVNDERNPTGDAVVWYSTYNGTVYIRCFVPGGGA